MKSYEILEENVGLLAVFMVIVVDIGGLTQTAPLFLQDVTDTPVEGMKLHTALELEGRDVYIREGYIGCHSRMVHPSRAETECYDHYSVVGESVWDHPFLWGSKRTGPDLAHTGSRYFDDWHRTYLYNLRNVVPKSKIPTYPWSVEDKLDGKNTATKTKILHKLGMPYIDRDVAGAREAVRDKTEVDALVAFLQGPGTSTKSKR